LSTLTKILIVLLTISAIFLCGIVVTYVANADNYRQKYDNLKSDRDSLSRKADNLAKQVNDKVAENQRLEDKLNGQIASLKTQLAKLQTGLSNAEREKAALLGKVNSWTSIVGDFTVTNEKQSQLLNDKLEELKAVQTDLIRQRKELKETTAALVEKMAIIDTLQSENRLLREEKSELQSRLDQLLRPAGKTAAPTVPVTRPAGLARPAPAIGEDIALTGQVTAVDLKNSMAGISLGSADGVKEGMKFHVTRGDQFLCDILIIDVDAEEAVGVLDLVQQKPRLGDKVSTNL